MKPKYIPLGLAVASLFFGNAFAASQLTEEKKAACEATMCLMAADQPTECDDSLKKYFEIQVKGRFGKIDPRETADAREDFLELCPKEDSEDRFRTETANQNINTSVDTQEAKENIASTDMNQSTVTYSEDERGQAQELGITEGQMAYYDEKAPEFDSAEIEKHTSLLDSNANKLASGSQLYNCAYDICIDGEPIIIDIGDIGGESGY